MNLSNTYLENLLDVYLKINPHSDYLFNNSIDNFENNFIFPITFKLSTLTNVDDITNIEFLTYVNYLNINDMKYIQFFNQSEFNKFSSKIHKEINYKQLIFEYRLSNKDIYLLLSRYWSTGIDLTIALKSDLSIKYTLSGGSYYKYLSILEAYDLLDKLCSLECLI